MLGAMRLDFVLALVGASLGASAGAAPRPGKVVRVERKPRGISGMPRYCSISSDMSGYCLGGKQPEIGEHVVVIDSQRTLGVVRITTVTPLPDQCNQNAVWMIQGMLETGDLASPQGQTLGVIDVPIDPRGGRLVTVDRSPAGHPWGTDQIQGVDSNGDGNVDLEFIQFPCDDAGTQASAATGTCLEVWAATTGHGLARIRQDRVRNCF